MGKDASPLVCGVCDRAALGGVWRHRGDAAREVVGGVAKREWRSRRHWPSSGRRAAGCGSAFEGFDDDYDHATTATNGPGQQRRVAGVVQQDTKR